MTDKIRILYVDDESSLLDIGKLFLEKTGDFLVTIIDSATAALALLKTEQFDIIISDYQMPDIDGLEFLKQVRLHHGQIPFILFTGRGREEVVILALNNGADFYLQKGGAPQPQFAELAHKIRQAVHRRQGEFALEESERRYRDIVETQTEFICRFKPDGTHVFANEAYYRHFGKRREEVIGHRFVPVIPTEDQKIVRNHFALLTRDHPAANIEHHVIMPDGSIRWHWWSDHAIFDEVGNVVEYQSLGKDITDRKQAEESLKKSDNLYRTIFEMTGAATIIIEKDTTISLANSGFAKISGYSIEELEGQKKWTDFVVKEDLERMKKYHSVRRNDPPLAPRVYEFKFINRFEEIRHCIVHVGLIPGTTRSVASVVDITDRVMIEQTLKESENLYRTIFNNTGAATIIIAPDTTIMLANDGWIKLTGVPKNEQENKKSWTVFIDKDDVERMKKYHYARRDDSTPVPKVYECKVIDVQNAVHHCFVYVDMIPGTKNSVASLVKITDRVVAEELYQTVFENTGIAMAILEEDTTISHVNEQMEKVWGYLRKEVEGRMKWPQLVAKEDLPKMLEYHRLRRTNPESTPTNYEFKFFHKNGELRHASLTAALITGTKKSVISIKDITESKKNEKELRESEEKFRALVEQSLDGIIITDLLGKLLYANRMVREIIEYPPDMELAGKVNVLDFLTPKFRLNAIYDFAKVAAGIDSYLVYYKVLTHEKNEIWIECIGKKITFEGSTAVLLSIRDISKRRRMEELYQTVFENTGTAMVILEEDTTISHVNAEMETIWGYSKEEIEGRVKWINLIAQEDRLKMLEYHRLLRMDPDSMPRQYEFRFIHKNGGLRDGFLTATMIPGTKKSVISIRDITEHKKTEQALLKSEDVFRQLEGQLPDYVIIHDGETILFVNVEGARLIGKTPEQIIGTSVLSYVAPEYHELIRKNIGLRHSGIPVEPYEVVLCGSSGEQRWVMVRATPIPNREKPTMLTVLTDFTNRKRVEEALRESEAKYRTIIENMQDLVYQTDVQGNLTMISPTGIRLAGYASPEAVLGKNIARELYVDPKEREQFLAELKEKGAVNNFPVRLKAGDGTIRYATASSHFYFNAQGKMLGVEGVLHDVTERKIAEKALLQANKKLLLLSGITRHDINNQLTVILGYLALMENQHPDPVLNDHFSKIITAANRISSMIRFTREYENIGVSDPAWQNTRTLVDTAAKDAPLGQVTLKNDIPAGIEVYADPLIVKVCYNLMDNAARYGGMITTIRFSFKEHDGDRIIVCEDDGNGVLAEEKEKIFDRGFGKNTGLGLALSREILSITGITLKETGEPGKGARFEITVPEGMWRIAGDNE